VGINKLRIRKNADEEKVKVKDKRSEKSGEDKPEKI